MNYHLQTHCPHCFALSSTVVCAACHFNREIYLLASAASHHLPLFTVLENGYVVGRVLGEGNFAIVYAGLREKDQLACAIKEYYPQELAQRGLDNKTVNPKRYQEQLLSWQARFIQEAQLLRSCYDYPSIESGVVRYINLIKQHNSTYLVMERLIGRSLSDYLTEQHKLMPDSLYLWLMPLLKTLQKLHNKGIYHRDISTNNIFLTAADQPVLMDFGLARAGVGYTVLKSVMLSVGIFIAPEQLNGDYCDQRTDLYSLGAVIYVCLHGSPPPTIEARRQGAALIRLVQTPTALALQRVAEQCLQLNPSARPHDVAQVLTMLTPQSFNSSASAATAVETVIPERTFTPPPAMTQLPPLATAIASKAPVSSKLYSVWYGLAVAVITLAVLVGLIYMGGVAYLNYDEQEATQRKQDNLLFSQAQTLADYQNYLKNCTTCESKSRAQDQVNQLELEQKAALSHEKQRLQEVAGFANAKTLEDLKKYVASCVICAEKAAAEDKINVLVESLKIGDESELAEQESQFKLALISPATTAEFYQQNCPKKLAFWQRTADEGYALAQFLLASCYRSGNGIAQDYKEAINWYGKAAGQGNLEAQYQLATLLQNGEGTVRSSKQAADWYRKAAEQGSVDAQYHLAVLYENGEGVGQDFAEAAKWYRKAAEHNHAQAQYSLGVMYLYGSGVEQDYPAALKWQRKAAEQGNPKAQYGVGLMYENGYGMEVNYQEAYNWYQRAAGQGNQDAVMQIKSLETGMVR
jgi:TPR repeat protein/serine/threonine protein kinase